MLIALLFTIRYASFLPYEFLDRRGLLVLVVVGVIVFLGTSARRPQHRCPKCREVNREQATYCAQCGTRLRDER